MYIHPAGLRASAILRAVDRVASTIMTITITRAKKATIITAVMIVTIILVAFRSACSSAFCC